MPSSQKWYVYMIRCKDKSLYTGITTDVERRFKQHKEGKNGSKYAYSRIPFKVVYVEYCASRSEAQTRESTIKQLPKFRKEALVTSKP